MISQSISERRAKRETKEVIEELQTEMAAMKELIAPQPIKETVDTRTPFYTENSEEGIETIELVTMLRSQILAMKQQIEAQGTRVEILEEIYVGNCAPGGRIFFNGRGEVMSNHDDSDDEEGEGGEEFDSDGEGFSEEGSQEEEEGDDDTIDESGEDE